LPPPLLLIPGAVPCRADLDKFLHSKVESRVEGGEHLVCISRHLTNFRLRSGQAWFPATAKTRKLTLFIRSTRLAPGGSEVLSAPTSEPPEQSNATRVRS